MDTKKMFQFTEELIKESFAQSGIESDFFPVFEKEARRAYEELQREFYICLMCEGCEEVDKEKMSHTQIEDLKRRFQ